MLNAAAALAVGTTIATQLGTPTAAPYWTKVVQGIFDGITTYATVSPDVEGVPALLAPTGGGPCTGAGSIK